MKIDEFYEKYNTKDIFSAEFLTDKWEKETAVDNFLNSTVTGSVTVTNLLIGDKMLDQVSPQLLEALQNSLSKKPQSYDEARNYLLKKLEDGDKSVFGNINNIKGKIGELEFKSIAEEAGLNVRLAPSLNQQGWDAAIDHPDYTEYIQVKMYSDPNQVEYAVKNLQEQLEEGLIKDEGNVISKVTFAIPDNIVEETSTTLKDAGLNVKLRSIPLSSAEAAEIVQDGFDNVDILAISNFFEELFTNSAVSFGLYSSINLAKAFLDYKNSKNINELLFNPLSSSIKPTVISSGAYSAGMLAESILNQIAFLGGIPSYVLIFTTTMSTRAIIYRIAQRQSYVEGLERDIAFQYELLNKIEYLT